MIPDDPRHGEYRGWAQHAREGEDPCAPCIEARRRYGRVRPHLTALGNPPKVPVGELAHKIMLALKDLTEREFTDHTGLSAVTRRRVLTGGPETIVRRTTQTKILALNPRKIRNQLLTVIGCTRRVQALAALGYSATTVAERSGIHPDTGRKIQRGQLEYVEYETRRRIAATYADLEHTRLRVDKITARAFHLAERNGWHPPAAWDHIDDPEFIPSGIEMDRKEADEIAVIRFLEGDRTVPTRRPERELIVAEYLRLGRPLTELERAGWKPERYMEQRDGAA